MNDAYTWFPFKTSIEAPNNINVLNDFGKEKVR